MPGDVVLVSRNQTESPVLITATDVPLAPPGGKLNDNDLRPVEVRAARAAVQAGVASASIERLPFDLSALESDGILVNVDARNFGLLDRRLDWQALGISLPRGTDLSFRPPRCGLVPDRYRLPLMRPAAQAHTALHRFSYSFRLVETVVRHFTVR